MNGQVRQIWEVPLRPVVGERFQPTGFPDIGAARFRRPVRKDGRVEWVDALLVESAQSMANRLEEVGWDVGRQTPESVLDGLPYIRVVSRDGEYLTSSRTEAHRLASAFVKDSLLRDATGEDDARMRIVIRKRLDLRDDVPLASRRIAAQVLAMDPLCLVHGVFFAESAKVWPGQPKVRRAVTGFVEALDVQEAPSGGVKRDEVRHSTSEGGAAKEGYGSIPFHRVEWTAGTILASFSLDLAQIRSYGLAEAPTRMLKTLARWQLRALLDRGLRLRTACDLEPVDLDVRDRGGEPLGPEDQLAEELRGLIDESRPELGPGEPIEVVWDPARAKV